jgi:hypothetical protein
LMGRTDLSGTAMSVVCGDPGVPKGLSKLLNLTLE